MLPIWKLALLIPTIRCGEQVEAVVIAFRQVDGLPDGRDCVWLAFGCGREVECNAVVGDFRGQHFAGQGLPFRIEAAGGRPVLGGGDRCVVIQLDWL